MQKKRRIFMPILNFTQIQIQIQILFPPQQIQIQIPAALHTPIITL